MPALTTAILARYAPHIALTVIALAIAGVVGHAVWTWGRDSEAARTVAAEARAAELAVELAGWRAAAVRDALSADATDTARANVADHVAEHQTRVERVETIAHANRDPVPAVCPVPDPDLLRELAEGRGRVRAAEDRLRGLRSAAGHAAE